MQDSPTAQEPHLDRTPRTSMVSALLLIPRRQQIPKQNFKGCFLGMGEVGRVGLLRNLLHPRLPWLPSHQVGPLSLAAASAMFFFYLLRVVSRVTASRRSNVNSSGLHVATIQGKKKKKLQCSLCHINQRNTSRAGCVETAFLVVPALHANHLPGWQ